MNWDLGKLYAGFDDPKFASDIAVTDENIALIQKKIADLKLDGTEAQKLAAIVEDMKTITGTYIKVELFVMLTLSANANDEQALARRDKMMLIGMEMQKVSSALSAFVGKIDDLPAVIAQNDVLKEHEYVLRCLKRDAQHVIDPVLEDTVLKMQMTGGNAWAVLRDQLDSNHMIPWEENGEVTMLPLSAIRGKAYDASADVRKRAYEAEIAAYPKMEIPMAACLNGIKGEALTMAQLRKYDSVLDWSLSSAKMDRETLDAMMQAMRESLPMFRRYFRIKAKLLGYDGGLKFYDLFAPVGSAARKFTVEEARQTLVREMGKFSKKMGDFIDFAFEDKWIDMFPREGKQGGAFCAPAHPLGTSYVLTNFDGSLSSVGTIAHELGHAYHNDCVKNESILNSDYPMPLAETASIFNETLLTQALLQSATDEEKMLLLDQNVSDTAQVIVDIMSRFIFESTVIDTRKDHAMTPKELKEIMLDAQKQTYGDGLDENCMHPYMWACKSHYYSADLHFYNFPYAFGQLFGNGVYALYKEQGEAFLPVYDALLRETARGDVYEVAKTVGIDVHDVNFWRKGLRTVEEAVDQLETFVK